MDDNDALLDATHEIANATLGPMKRPLPELVAEVSRTYTRGRDDLGAASRREGLQARLRFFLHRDLTKIEGPLAELAAAGALPEKTRWRVLDLGAGVGTTSLGLARWAARRGVTLDIVAVDRDPLGLRCCASLAKRAGISLEARLGDVRRPPDGRFDLITLGLVLNELPPDERRACLEAAAASLHPEGSLIILEPALRGTARSLQALRDDLERDASWTVFAPCLRREACPMLLGERDWCHEDAPFRLPEALIPVARAAGLRWERATYSYLTLRRDGRRLRDHADGGRVVGGPLVTKGKQELIVCDDEGLTRLVRLNRHRGGPSAAFDDAGRGDVLRIEGAALKGRGQRIGPDAYVEKLDSRER